jgi:hypothetical protein
MALFKQLAAAAIVSFVLAGCGGGGGGGGEGGDPRAPTAAEGAYEGTASDGSGLTFDLDLLILENGETWAFLGYQGIAAGFMQGSGISSNSNYAIPDARFFSLDVPGKRGSLNATYNPSAKTIVGSAVVAGEPLSFQGRAAGYDYAAPADLKTVTGSWTLAVTSNYGVDRATLNISPTGSWSGAIAGGCSMTGSLQPRPSGKNVFDLTASFGPAPCAYPGQSVRGVALAVPWGGQQAGLVMMAINTARTVGIMAQGARGG